VSTKEKQDNQGSGLAIAKLLIEEQLFGTIKVKNGDEGACFTITVPQ